MPTPTPRPTVGNRVNPAQHYRLAAAKGAWVKGPARGGATLDAVVRERLVAALDVEVRVERGIRHDDRQTIYLSFGSGEQEQLLRYHPDVQRVYVHEDQVSFAAPPAFVAALAPLVEPLPEPAVKPPRATEAPVAPGSNVPTPATKE